MNLKGANENTNLNVDGQDIDKAEVVTVDFQENVFKYPGDDFEFTEENLQPDQKQFEFETRHYVLETISKSREPFLCKNCGISYKRLYSLTIHEKTHSKKKLFICDKCPQKFKDSESRIHFGEKSYLCNICGKRFARLGPFRKHENLHTQQNS